jgi:catechol 2,3-dioxygenase-like lactoylglutathione lyase family enzyme
MTTFYLFAGVAVSDFAAARTWYEALFGRPPDMLPEEGEAVWQVSALASMYITVDAVRAGSGAVVMAVPDLEAHAGALAARGLSPVDPAPDATGPRRLRVTDDDGNTITFFQDAPAMSSGSAQ